VLQCDAVCCSVLQCVAMRHAIFLPQFGYPRCVAVYCNVLQYVEV